MAGVFYFKKSQTALNSLLPDKPIAMHSDIQSAVSILQRTPVVLSNLLSGLDETWTHTNEGEGTWSPFDVVGHLIHGEKTDWIPRIRIILDNVNEGRFEPFDRFAQQQISVGKAMTDLLEEFSHLRTSNLEQLMGLDLQNEQLQMTGIHPEFGEVTLKNHLSAWVVHDLGHIAQITRTMSKVLKEDVGPWVKYMSVLHRK